MQVAAYKVGLASRAIWAPWKANNYVGNNSKDNGKTFAGFHHSIAQKHDFQLHFAQQIQLQLQLLFYK